MSAALTSLEETLAFIAVLASVGVTHADVTFLSLDKGQIDGKKIGGEKVLFESGMSIADLRNRLPGMIADADRRERSVVVSHPRAPGIKLIQCDDVSGEVLERLKPVAFMAHETSPGRFQAWVAMREAEAASGDFYRRLRKGVGSDRSASESTRSPGSHNFKSKYGPDYPMIRLRHLAPGKLAIGEELEASGLLAAPMLPKQSAPRPSAAPLAQKQGAGSFRAATASTSTGAKRLPDYEECRRHGERLGDRDLGDQRFSWIAAERGFDEAEIAAQLLRLSPKAAEQRDPERYCQRKAEAGVKYAEQRRAQGLTKTLSAHTLTWENPQSGRHEPARGLKTHSGLAPPDAPAGSEEAVPLPEPESVPPRPAAPSSPTRPNGISVVGEARHSRTLAFCSTPEDAAAVFAASGIPAVVLGGKVPARLRERTALKRVLVATRAGAAGEALARRLIEICSLASLQYVPVPANGASEEALRAIFAAASVSEASAPPELEPEATLPLFSTVEEPEPPAADPETTGLLDCVDSTLKLYNGPGRKDGLPLADFDPAAAEKRYVLGAWLWYGRAMGCYPAAWPEKWPGYGRCSECRAPIKARTETTAFALFREHVESGHAV
jgi:hypothetical protein